MHCAVFPFRLYVCKCERQLRRFIDKHWLDVGKGMQQLTCVDPVVFDTPDAYQAKFGTRAIYDLDHLVKFNHGLEFVTGLDLTNFYHF